MTGPAVHLQPGRVRGQRVDQLDDPGGEHVGVGRRALASDPVGGQRLEVHGDLQAGLLRAVEHVAQPPQVPAAADVAALPRHDHGVDAGVGDVLHVARDVGRAVGGVEPQRLIEQLRISPRRRDPTTDTSGRAPADRDAGRAAGRRSGAAPCSCRSSSPATAVNSPTRAGRASSFTFHTSTLDVRPVGDDSHQAQRRRWFDDTTRRKVALAGRAVGVARDRDAVAFDRGARVRGRSSSPARPRRRRTRRASTRSRVVRAVVADADLDADGIDDGIRQRLRMARRGLAGLEHGRGEHEAGDTHASSIGRPERRRSPSVGRLIDHHRAARDGRLAALAGDPRPRRVAQRDHRRPAGLGRRERLGHAHGHRARPQPPRSRPATRRACRAARSARPARPSRPRPGTRRGGTASPPARGRTCLPGR